MKNPILLTTIFIILLSCKITGKHTSQGLIPHQVSKTETFEDFNAKFHADSAFQLTRITFPLGGHQVDAFEEKGLKKESWQVMKVPVEAPIDTLEYNRIIERTDSSVTEEIWVEDSGFHVKRTFKQRSGKWFLTFYNDTNL